MMLSTEIGKEFDKIQHPFMIKTIIKVDIEKQESEVAQLCLTLFDSVDYRQFMAFSRPE